MNNVCSLEIFLMMNSIQSTMFVYALGTQKRWNYVYRKIIKAQNTYVDSDSIK